MPIKLDGGLCIGEGSLHGVTNVKEASIGGSVGAGSIKMNAKWGSIKGDINNQEDLIALFQAINIDSLIQDPNSFFILDCGSSTEVIGE